MTEPVVPRNNGQPLKTTDYITDTRTPEPKTKDVEWKFNEAELLAEVEAYVKETYKQHYSSGKIQPMELIISSGNGSGFCMGNIVKYACRYGVKNGKNRDDLMKILHYTLLSLYVHDEEKENK